MTITDPIADFLTRIRNALAVRKKTVDIPYSKMKMEILKILKKEGYIEDFQKDNYKIEIKLKYLRKDRPAISEIRRISRPGCRIYTGKKQISKYKKGHGIVIISTPLGVISDKEALSKATGGEVICEIW